MATKSCSGNPAKGQKYCDNSQNRHGQNTYILDAFAFSTSGKCSDCGNVTPLNLIGMQNVLSLKRVGVCAICIFRDSATAENFQVCSQISYKRLNYLTSVEGY